VIRMSATTATTIRLLLTRITTILTARARMVTLGMKVILITHIGETTRLSQ